MTGTEIYKRTEIYDREARSIRLHAPEWKLLLAYDGQRSLAEVALSAEVPFADALPLTERFLASNWIAEQPITLDQYLKRTGAPNVSGIGAAVPPPIILHEPRPQGAPLLPLTPVQEKTGATPPPVPIPTSAAPIKRGPMRLSAVVDFIASQVDTLSLGQLLVYRVFLRVPPELLQAEDIASVHLVGDTSVIQGSVLQQAIASAVHEVTRRALPDSVFAPA